MITKKSHKNANVAKMLKIKIKVIQDQQRSTKINKDQQRYKFEEKEEKNNLEGNGLDLWSLFLLFYELYHI